MKCIITHRPNGEYSTIALPDGTVETCWFGDDGSSKVIDRTSPPTLREVAVRHIAEYEGKSTND